MALPDLGPTGAVPPRKETGPSAALRYAFGAKPPSTELFGETAAVSPPQDPHVIRVENEDVAVGIGDAARKVTGSPPTLPTGTLQPPLSPGGTPDSEPVSDVTTREPEAVEASAEAQVFPANKAGDTTNTEAKQQPELLQPLRLGEYDEYQVFRPGRSEMPREEFASMLERVRKLDAAEREALAANPFSDSSRATLDEIFPDASPLDQARAIVLVQPATVYDEAFAKLSPDDEKKELYRYTDRTADMVVRYDTFVETHDDSLWEMSPEEIYQQATAAVLPPETQDNLSGYQLRTYRLMAVNLIGDLETFRPYRQQQDVDPITLSSEILGIPISGDPIVDVRPYGIMITLDPEDYKLANRKYKKDRIVDGLTLHGYGPPALDRRLGIATNYDAPQYKKQSLQAARKDGIYTHEYTHIKTDTLRTPAVLKADGLFQGKLPFTEALADHRKFAEALGKMELADSQFEIIAYAAQDYFKVTPDNLMIVPFDKALHTIKRGLMGMRGLTPEQKTEIYEVYENEYIQYLNDIRTHFWIAHSLSTTVEDSLFLETSKAVTETGSAIEKYQSSLTRAKAVALLQVSRDREEINRLGIYFGVDPDKLPQTFQTYQRYESERYTFVRQHYSHNSPLAREVAQTFPEEALPELCKTLKESNRNPRDIAITVNTVGLILAINYKNMSLQDFKEVWLALHNVYISMPADPDYDEARELVYGIYQRSAQYTEGTQFQFEVAEFWDRTQPPTVKQAAQYVSAVTRKKDTNLWETFRHDIIPILGENSQGIPALIDIGNSAYYFVYKTAAINTLRDNISNITSDQRPEVKHMLLNILTSLRQKDEGEMNEVEVDLKNAAQSLIDSLKIT